MKKDQVTPKTMTKLDKWREFMTEPPKQSETQTLVDTLQATSDELYTERSRTLIATQAIKIAMADLEISQTVCAYRALQSAMHFLGDTK